MSYSRSLLTFAFVHEALQRGDIIGGIAPLLAPAVKKRHGKPFEPTAFANDLREMYALDVHPYILEDWAPRLCDAGLLTIADSDEDYVRYLYANPDVASLSQVEADIEIILADFREYLLASFAALDVVAPSNETIENMFLGRIRDMEFDDIVGKNDPDIDSKDVNDKNQDSNDEVATLDEMFDVACASFVLDLRERSPKNFDRLVEIAGGALAAEVILSFRTPSQVETVFKGKQVFFDSPIALDRLGFGAKEECEFAEYVIEGLRALGAVPCIYQHNMEELVEVLRVTKANYESGRAVSGAVGARIMTDPNARVKISSVIAGPLRKMKEINLQVVDAAAIDKPLLQFFDKASELDLISAIRPFSPIVAREVDAASIASLIRYVLSKRPARNVTSFEKLFVTKNPPLVRAAARYMSKINLLSEEDDSPIVRDRYLAGLLWLAKGGVADDIPTRALLANCTAAVRPRRDVISKTRSVLRSISPQDAKEFEAIIENDKCAYYLMRHSLGAAHLVTDKNAIELAKKVKMATALEVAERKDAEIKAQAALHESAMSAAKMEAESQLQVEKEEKELLKNRLGAAMTEINAAKSEASQLLEKLVKLEERNLRDDKAVIEDAFRATSYIKFLSYVVLYLLLAVTAYVVGELVAPQGVTGAALSGLALFFVGVLQFAVFPDLIVGRFIRNKREQVLRKRIKAKGLDGYAVSIDWRYESVQVERPES